MAQLNESILTNQTVQSLQSIVAKVSSDPINSLVLIGAAVILIRGVLSLLSGNGIKAPYGALPQINEGYEKFKNTMFKVSRNNKDVLIISNKYIDELRNLPGEKLSSIEALIKKIAGKYTASEIMLEGNVPTRLLQTKLTSNIASFTSIMKDEIDRAISDMDEKYNDWGEVPIYHMLGSLINKISNRVFLGEVDGRNEAWGKASHEFSHNVTLTVMLIRTFPLWMRPLVSWLIPPAYKVQSSLRAAKKTLVPVILRRRENEKDPNYERPDDFLQWMMDAANESEFDPEKLTHRQLILILGSVHTTTMAGAHVFYDLCAHPDYFEPLRKEIQEVMREGGGTWMKTTLTKLRKPKDGTP